MRTLFLLILAPLIALPEAHGAADLLSIYRDAQNADAVYASARAAYDAGKEVLPQGRAGLLPSVSLSGNTQINDRDLTFRGAAGLSVSQRYNTNNVTIVGTQPLFNYQSWITYQRAKDQVSQAEAQFLQTGQDLIVRVAQAYFDVLLAEFNVTLAAAQKEAIGEQLAQAKRNFEVGSATITDANDAQARYDLTVSQEIAAQNDLEVKKQALEQIIAKRAPELAKIGPNFSLAPPAPNNMDQWVEQAMNSSFQVKIAQANLDIAAKSVEFSRAGHLPTVNAIASYTDQGSGAGVQGGPGFDSSTTFMGLQLAVPIFQGGLVNSQVRQAVANIEKARQDLENAKRTAAFNTKQSFLGVTNGMAQAKALQAALVSSQSSLDSSKLGQEVGVRTQVDVLNAQQQLISARRDYAQTLYNYVLSALRLKAAAGTLTEEDLAYINAGLVQ